MIQAELKAISNRKNNVTWNLNNENHTTITADRQLNEQEKNKKEEEE